MNPVTRAAMGVHYTLFKNIVRLFVTDPVSLDRLAIPMGKIRRRVGYIGSNRSPKRYLDAIQEALPEIGKEDTERVLGEFWLDHQRKFLSLFLVPRLTPRNVGDWVEFQGLEHLDEALQAGKGALLPYPHFGNERIHHVSIALKGYPMSVVSSEYVDYASASRAAKLDPVRKIHHVGFRGDSPRWMIQWLKKNGVLQIASTAEAGTKGIWVQILDKRLFLSSGWIRLAALTGARIVPSLIRHRPGDRHLLQVYPSFEIPSSVNSVEDMIGVARKFFDILEPEFRRHPGEIDWMTWLARCDESDQASNPSGGSNHNHDDKSMDLGSHHRFAVSGDRASAVGTQKPLA
jgi:KDO2-lipid IV(A) lauroyltransferase